MVLPKPQKEIMENEKAQKPKRELDPMHLKFIHLRTQGWTFARIAQEMNMCKNTVINWSRKFQFELQNERAIILEAIANEFLASREDRIRKLGNQLRAAEAELAKRDISEVSTSRLFTLVALLRRELQKEAGSPQFTSPTDEIPRDEYHEQVQIWKA